MNKRNIEKQSGHIVAPVFYVDGKRTCASNFFDIDGVCPFFRTFSFGTKETCLFANNNETIERDNNGKGFLITPKWCPIKT